MIKYIKLIFLTILMAVSLTSCADIMMLTSSVGVATSQNLYVKAYNGVDILTIASTQKDLKQHAYNKIIKKSQKDNEEDIVTNSVSYQLQIIAHDLKKLNKLNEEILTKYIIKLNTVEEEFKKLTNRFKEVSLKLDKLSNRVTSIQSEKISVASIMTEVRGFFKDKTHKQSSFLPEKSPRKLALALQFELKKTKR